MKAKLYDETHKNRATIDRGNLQTQVGQVTFLCVNTVGAVLP